MSEADGMEDAVVGAMRTGLMVAGRIGEQLARTHEQEQRTIAAAEEQRARELQERFNSQRAAARAQLVPLSREDWWDKATPEMIEGSTRPPRHGRPTTLTPPRLAGESVNECKADTAST